MSKPDISVFRIQEVNTVVILLGDVIRGNLWVVQAKWKGVSFERSLWEPEVLLKVHELFTELLSMEVKYAVKLSITDLIKISRNIIYSHTQAPG